MKAMLLAVSVLSVLATFGSASPLEREKRFAPFTGGFAYAGFPFGAYAGTGMNPFAPVPSPWDVFSDFPRQTYSRPSYVPFPWVPFPVIPIPQNWYEGDNVCKEVKTVDAKTPDDFMGWMDDVDLPNFQSNFNHEQESCKGTNSKYVCIKQIYDSSGQSKLQATKYECCHGFVRNSNGPGCVETAAPNGGQPPQQAAGAQTGLNAKDKAYYDFVPTSSVSRSSSASFSAGSVDKVPIQ